MTKGGINHIALTVRDLAAARTVLRAGAGLPRLRKVEDITGKMTLWVNVEARAA